MLPERDADIMMELVLFGNPEAGFLTNPETQAKQGFIEVNGEKVVCLAKGGECRHSPKYYGTGMGDPNFWKTPIIEESCPNRCPYKVLVCDNHERGCEGSFTRYPEHNKFRGQFSRYCKEFSRLEMPKQ